jgi:hypothetical protein
MKKITFAQIQFILCFLVFLSSSFDLFLNLKLGGFSIRFALAVMVIQIIIFILHLIKIKFREPVHFLGFKPFIIWFLFLIAFIPNTTILSRNIGYIFWLSIFTVYIIILPYFIKTEEGFIKLIKYYILSFGLVAVFGLIQFVAGLGGISLLTAQWWLNGRLPRINGFSYEPSYFSTYVLICWVICFFLMINRNKLVYYFNARITFLIITVSLFLSTSRMGLLFMFIIILGFIFNQIKNTFITFKIKARILPLFLLFVTFIGSCAYYVIFYFNKIKFMFLGLGIFGYADHSTGQRITEFIDTLKAFLKSPFIGYSLGGIPSAIAKVRGTRIGTQYQAKDYEGMNIFAETLAASGIFGFIFFISFLIIIFYKTNRLIKDLRPVNPQFSTLLLALLLGLLFELLILNMNQNILRTYLWIHIGIVNLGFFVGKNILQKSRTE